MFRPEMGKKCNIGIIQCLALNRNRMKNYNSRILAESAVLFPAGNLQLKVLLCQTVISE